VPFCPTIGVFVLFHKFTFAALFVAGGGLYFFFRGLLLLARRHSFATLPNCAIRDAALGPLGVAGVAVGPHTLVAPVTGKPCFAYSTTAWQKTGSIQKTEWKQVAEETMHLPFFVEDLTGRLQVEPFEAELDLRADYCQEFGTLFSAGNRDSVPPRVRVFLARHGISSGFPTRVEERTLEPSSSVFIAGTVAANAGVRLSERPNGGDGSQSSPMHQTASRNSPAQAGSPEVIRLFGGPTPSTTTAMTQQEKIAAALLKAGITKPEAWAVAGLPCPDAPLFRKQEETGSASNAIFSPPQAPAPPPPDCESLVLMKGEGDSRFVISYRSRQELSGPPAWESAAMALGGAVLSTFGTYVLLFGRSFR
jgi:E3 Ubiquitin ligase